MNNLDKNLNELLRTNMIVDFLGWLYGSDNLFQGATGLT